MKKSVAHASTTSTTPSITTVPTMKAIFTQIIRDMVMLVRVGKERNGCMNEKSCDDCRRCCIDVVTGYKYCDNAESARHREVVWKHISCKKWESEEA